MPIRRRHNAEQATESADPDALLVAWSQQHPQAFTALYDRYFDAVYGYCVRHLGESGASEDAASQTFLKALAALPNYREAGRFRSWLFAIAHNVIQDMVRTQRPEAPLEAAIGIHDSATPPEDRAIAALDRAWLDGVIARLPAADRAVLELRRAGLRGPEIAAVLGISHEAAKKRQLRAIDQIRAEAGVSTEKREVLRGA